MSHRAYFRAGLVILALLSAQDLLLPLVTDGEHPPLPVALAAAVVGLISLVLIVSAWRGASRAVPVLIVVRLLSALSAAPAFMAPDVPSAAIAAAAVIVGLTLVGSALVLVGARRGAMAGAR